MVAEDDEKNIIELECGEEQTMDEPEEIIYTQIKTTSSADGWKVKCPSCLQKYKVYDSLVNRKIRCICGFKFVIHKQRIPISDERIEVNFSGIIQQENRKK